MTGVCVRSRGMTLTVAERARAPTIGLSQFSREYSRFFGQPPMRDVKSLRDGKAVPANAA